MKGLLRAAPPLAAVWGWACLALAAPTSVAGVAAAGVGLVAAVLPLRSALLTGAVQLSALTCIAAVASPARTSFLVAGVVFGGASHAIAHALRRGEVG